MKTHDITSPKHSVVTAVTFYWVVSISLVFLNKIAMSGDLQLDAPLFLTWTQIVFAVLGCAVLSSLKPSMPSLAFFPHFEYKFDTAIAVMPLTVVFIGMIVFNNLCLKYVEVSFYQVARSLTILFNIVFSYLILGDSTSNRALGSVIIVVIGYLLGCDGEMNFSLTGSIFGITASVFVALYSIYVKKILGKVNNDKWLLMIYNNVNALFILPIFVILSGEVDPVLGSSAYYSSYFWTVIVSTGIFGFLINIATFAQIQATSPLTHNVSGTAKAGFQTMLAYAVFGNPTTFMGIAGIILVLAGSLLYGYIRMNEGKAPVYEKVEGDDVDVDIELQMKPTERP